MKYTSESGYCAPDWFQYTITDGNGHYDTADVELDVEPKFYTVDDTAATNKVTPIGVGVLGNDYGAASVTAVGSAAHGTTQNLGYGRVRYTPNAGYEGEDSFTYTATDGQGHYDTASGEVLGTMVGRWYAADGKLVCDMEESWLVRAKRVLPARWRGSHMNMIDWYTIESIDDEDLVLRARGGPATFPLRRVEGR